MLDPILLPERLDAATAPDLAQTLLTSVTQGDVTLDARNTTHVGAMGAQVLLSAQQTVQAAGHDFRLSHVQDRAREQFDLMGLSNFMMPESD